jgi:hypothetical protein
MIIFIVHDLDILTIKPEGNSPIATNINCPRSGSVALQFVKPKAWKVHILRLSGRMKAAEYQTESFGVLGLDSRSLSGFEEAF